MISRLASMSVFSYPSLRWGTFACIKAAGQGYHPFRRKSWERKFSAIGPIRIARAINRIARMRRAHLYINEGDGNNIHRLKYGPQNMVNKFLAPVPPAIHLDFGN